MFKETLINLGSVLSLNRDYKLGNQEIYRLYYIKKATKIVVCSNSSVRTLNNLLNIERLGFQKVNINSDEKKDNIIDLFTISGKVLLIKYSEYYSRYIEWYSENVTYEEVENIL